MAIYITPYSDDGTPPRIKPGFLVSDSDEWLIIDGLTRLRETKIEAYKGTRGSALQALTEYDFGIPHIDALLKRIQGEEED